MVVSSVTLDADARRRRFVLSHNSETTEFLDGRPHPQAQAHAPHFFSSSETEYLAYALVVFCHLRHLGLVDKGQTTLL